MTSENLPNVSFSYSLRMETRRVLYYATKLQDGRLQHRGFLVLPKLYNQSSNSIIVFPDLPYTSIPNFWTRTSKLKLATPLQAPAQLLQALESLIHPIYQTKLYDQHIIELESKWKSVEKQFWSNLFSLFPHYQNSIESVKVYSTQFGTYSTFSLPTPQNRSITIYIRQDSGLDCLIWTLLTCIFRPTMETTLKMSWEEIQASIDWLMTESSLNCGIKMTQTSIKNLRATQAAIYRQKSQAYLEHLGFTIKTKLTKQDDKYYFGNTQINNLSSNETTLLKLLYTHTGTTVTFEEIANTLWTNNPDWTLYAVVKAVERLRKRISQNGIHLPLIHTERKVGYSIS